MEAHLLGTSDGQVLQVPLTYRGAPRDSAEHSLVTEVTHATLGDRWVHDAGHDSVHVTARAAAVLTGGREADLFMATEDGLVQCAAGCPTWALADRDAVRHETG